MRVVVTGSSGFIGGHVVAALLDAGHEILGVDIEPALTQHPGYTHALADIRDPTALTHAFNTFQPAAVLHLAARTDLAADRVEEYSANTDGTRSMLAAVRATPGIRRVICTSSQLVCRVGYTPAHDQDFAPDTAYGKSKVMTEQICRAEAGGGADWCIVRPTTIWGPRMNPHYLRFFRLIRRGLYFHVGGERRLKAYGYVGNTAHQYVQLLAAPAARIDGKVFYLADYEPLDLRAWADAFAQALSAPRIRQLPRAVALIGARIGDLINAMGGSTPLTSFRLRNVLASYRFDLAATQAVCGPLPYDLHAGVAETTRWLETVL